MTVKRSQASKLLFKLSWVRRLFRFRLRHLLLLMLLCCLGLGFLANKYRARAAVVKALDEAGAFAGPDPIPVTLQNRHLSIYERFIAAAFGEDSLRRVEFVSIGPNGLSGWCYTYVASERAPGEKDLEALLASLVDFQELCYLFIGNASLTDSALESISRLEQLEELRVLDARFNEDAASKLGRLKNLEVLELSADSLSDEGLKELRAQLPNCTVFRSTPLKELPADRDQRPPWGETIHRMDQALLTQ